MVGWRRSPRSIGKGLGSIPGDQFFFRNRDFLGRLFFFQANVLLSPSLFMTRSGTLEQYVCTEGCGNGRIQQSTFKKYIIACGVYIDHLKYVCSKMKKQLFFFFWARRRRRRRVSASGIQQNHNFLLPVGFSLNKLSLIADQLMFFV